MLGLAVVDLVELGLERVERREPVALDLVAELVDEPREAVDRHQLPPRLGAEHARGHREVLLRGERQDVARRRGRAAPAACRLPVTSAHACRPRHPGDLHGSKALQANASRSAACRASLRRRGRENAVLDSRPMPAAASRRVRAIATRPVVLWSSAAAIGLVRLPRDAPLARRCGSRTSSTRGSSRSTPRRGETPDQRFISLTAGVRPGLVWMTLGGMSVHIHPLVAIRLSVVLFGLLITVCGTVIAYRYIGTTGAIAFAAARALHAVPLPLRVARPPRPGDRRPHGRPPSCSSSSSRGDRGSGSGSCSVSRSGSASSSRRAGARPRPASAQPRVLPLPVARSAPGLPRRGSGTSRSRSSWRFSRRAS